MAHEIENAFFVRQPAWHRLGKVLPDAPTVEDGIRFAGLDWHVSLQPVFTSTGEQIPHYRRTARDSDGTTLGIVKDGYRPLQNAEAFEFFQPFIDGGACQLEAAGSLREGRRVWVLARLRELSAEVVDGDAVRGYFLLSNSHDGSQAVRTQFTSIRVVCANTLRMAHSRADAGREASLSVRHTASVQEGLTAVQKTVDMAERAFRASVEDYQRMVSRSLPVDGLKDYVSEVLEVSPELRSLGQMPRAWGDIQRAYWSGPGAQLKGVFGTFWGAFNAVTDWVDHSRGRDESRRLDANWFGDGKRIKERAFEVALGA